MVVRARLIRVLPSPFCGILWFQAHQGLEESWEELWALRSVPPSSHHPPALSYWKEQMQMDPKHNTQNTLPCFLGACCKLKLGSSWGLTFSLVQTTSAPHRAWQKVKESVTAIVDSSETEEREPPHVPSTCTGEGRPTAAPTHVCVCAPSHVTQQCTTGGASHTHL